MRLKADINKGTWLQLIFKYQHEAMAVTMAFFLEITGLHMPEGKYWEIRFINFYYLRQATVVFVHISFSGLGSTFIWPTPLLIIDCST